MLYAAPSLLFSLPYDFLTFLVDLRSLTMLGRNIP